MYQIVSRIVDSLSNERYQVCKWAQTCISASRLTHLPGEGKSHMFAAGDQDSSVILPGENRASSCERDLIPNFAAVAKGPQNKDAFLEISTYFFLISLFVSILTFLSNAV